MKQLHDRPTGGAPVPPPAVHRVLPPARQPSDGSPGARMCEPLASLLHKVAQIDQLQADIVALIGGLRVSTADVEQTGIPADLWLAVEGRMTISDRRMLAAVAEHLQRLPLTAREFARGGLSWSQVRTLVAILLRERPRAGEWEAFDAAITSAVGQARADDPDEVVRLVEDWVHARRPEVVADEEAQAAERRWLHIQPRLDGLGGRFQGETDALGLALLDAATAPTADQLNAGLAPGRGIGRARHDNLMARLAASDAEGIPAVTNLLTMDVETLIGLSNTDAELLVTLTGGRLRVSAPTARRLLAGGFDNRLIVLDETGQVLGVGRRSRVTPGWFRDALLVRDAVCTHPTCRRAGRTCQADHARPWWPTRSEDQPGETDINNVALVCGPHNRAKERTGWKVKGHDDGSRTWHHPRSGLTARTNPTTRRIRPPTPTPSDRAPPPLVAGHSPSPPSRADPPTPF